MEGHDVTDSFQATQRFLKHLLRVKYLHPDAKKDIAFMVRLHESGEFRLDRWNPIVFLYPFLFNPHSPAGNVLRSVLRGYSGDLFQQAAAESAELIDDESPDRLPFIFETRGLYTASRYYGAPLHSGDLLLAFLISPYTDGMSQPDAAEDRQRYKDLKLGKCSDISPYLSGITSFLAQRRIDAAELARRLVGCNRIDDSPEGIRARFSLAIGVLRSGKIRVQVLERWGQHEVCESQGMQTARNGLWLPETALFLPEEVAEFEFLLNSKRPVPEATYQSFFEEHPKWLYLLGSQYEAAIPQVRLPPVSVRSELALSAGDADEMLMKPDFLLKRVGMDLWDILDIKRSSCRVVVGGPGRRKFSEAVSEAIAQVREYVRRLRDAGVRERLRRLYGVNAAEPVALLLVGRDFDFRSLQEKARLHEREGVRVYTYDDLQKLARHRMVALADDRA